MEAVFHYLDNSHKLFIIYSDITLSIYLLLPKFIMYITFIFTISIKYFITVHTKAKIVVIVSRERLVIWAVIYKTNKNCFLYIM